MVGEVRARGCGAQMQIKVTPLQSGGKLGGVSYSQMRKFLLALQIHDEITAVAFKACTNHLAFRSEVTVVVIFLCILPNQQRIHY